MRMRKHLGGFVKMAAVPSRSFGRSFSYPDASEDMHRSSITQKRYVRSNSIVGSFWNMLYTRRTSSAGLEQLQSEDDTDHPQSEAESAAKQEDAWMQAYYNALALVVLVIAGCICWSVYCVLEPFLHPLLWAVLVGTLLHPFKKTWTQRISQWLDGLEGSSIPLSAGLLLSPIFFFNYLSKSLESAVAMHWGVMLGSVAGVVLLWLLYKLSVPIHLYHTLTSIYSFFHSIEGALTSYTGLVQLATLTIGFVLLLVITKSQVHLRFTTAFAILSTCVWFLALLSGATYILGSAVALPLVVLLFVTGACVSFAATLRDMLDSFNGRRSPGELGRRVSTEEGGESEVREGGGDEGMGDESPSYLEEVRCSGALEGEGEGGEEEGGITLRDNEREASIKPESARVSFERPGDMETRSRVSFGSVTEVETESPTVPHEYASESRPPILRKKPTDGDEFSHGDYVFLGLYSAFFTMILWTYPFLLILLVPFAVWAALKRAISVGRSTASLNKFSPRLVTLRGWLASRKSLLVPPPIPTLFHFYLTVDRKILKIAKHSVGSLISLFIICGLLVSLLGLTVFLVLQIQVELSHYVTMMAAVWDRARDSSPQLAE